jgi:hypothetical protein
METLDKVDNPGFQRAGAVGFGINAKESLYDVLNISPSASSQEIREAYIRMKSSFAGGGAALYSIMNEDQVQEQLKRIEEAFRILNDESRRKIYDRESQARLAAKEEIPLEVDDSFAARNQNSEQIQKMATRNDLQTSAKMAMVRAVQASNPEVKQKMMDEILKSDLSDGDLLKRIRTICQVEEYEMVGRTKVTLEYLRAVEENSFDKLPQAVFVKGFLKSYLTYLGVQDPDNIAIAYSERLKNWQSERRKT